MGAYAGYNIKIDGVTIPNSVIKLGTYQHTPQKRVRSERTDANGIHHFKYYNTLRHRISFTVKAGTKAQFDSIKAAFASRNSVTVKFWDEDSEDYLRGTFEINAPTWVHAYSDSSTYYFDEAQIELIQH